MEVFTSDRTEVKVIKENPQQCMIIGMSGHGKTIGMERIIESYHKKGYIIVCLTDVKDEWELCYASMKPKEKYHLEILKKDGIEPSSHKIRIFSPFSFGIPKHKLPPVNFFTIPLKALGREELSMLCETHRDSNTMKLLLNGISNMKSTDSIYEYLYKIERSIERSKEKVGDATIVRRDWTRFGLKGAMAGSVKDIEEIQSMFSPFLKDYFLVDNGCALNLDVEKDIFSNQEEYKILVTPFIKDKKMKYFTIICFFFQIIRQIKKSKKPVLFVVDEIRTLCPFRGDGYKAYMAEILRDELSTMRSKGRGCGTILGSQVYFDIDEKVRDSATRLWLGKLGSAQDIERIGKSLKYDADTVRLLKNLERNKYLLMGFEELEGLRIPFPSHRHAEAKYNFVEMYCKRFEGVFYSKLIKEMRDKKRDEFKEFRDKVMKLEEKHRKKLISIKKGKDDSKGEKEKSKKSKVKEVKEEVRKEKGLRCWEEYKRMQDSGDKFSWRELGRRLNIDSKTCKRYVNEKIKEEEREKAVKPPEL